MSYIILYNIIYNQEAACTAGHGFTETFCAAQHAMEGRPCVKAPRHHLGSLKGHPHIKRCRHLLDLPGTLCVCVCARARACVCVCVCVLYQEMLMLTISKS